MNSVEAARVLAKLHGAFPNVDIDEAVAATWANSLASADYTWAMRAADEWIASENWWPKIAEFNSVMTRLRRESAGQEAPSRMLPAHHAIRCNGSGFIDRGNGNEPCPTCNGWLRDVWLKGEWNERVRPPRDLVQPPRCRPDHSGEGSDVASRDVAMAAVLRGLREHYVGMGLGTEEVEARMAKRMAKVEALVQPAPEADIDHLHPV